MMIFFSKMFFFFENDDFFSKMVIFFSKMEKIEKRFFLQKCVAWGLEGSRLEQSQNGLLGG